MRHILVAMGLGIALFGRIDSASAQTCDYTQNAGSCSNSIGGTANYATIGGGFHNSISGGYNGPTIPGGYYNTVNASYATIGGGSSNLIDAGSSYGAICGGSHNTIDSSAVYNVIGGGLYNAIDEYSDYSFIGGGDYNHIWGGTSGSHANFNAIVGGEVNYIDYPFAHGFIGGGRYNEISGHYASVLGGDSNLANGDYSVVAGGADNTAYGQRSFAAGSDAYADTSGCFVWADYSGYAQTCKVNGSTASNAFVVRATGGVQFVTGLDGSGGAMYGAFLGPGSGTWSSLSDQNVKSDIQDVNTRDVLERVAAMPLATWRYTGEASGALHMGPMAQDFYAAFKLGDDNRHITTVDADGVALAAIQALYHEGVKKDEVIASLSSRVVTLEKANVEAHSLAESLEKANRRAASLEKRLEQIEAQLLGLKK